ncbi:ABC transporter, ATP-binding protein [Lachnospiraceae bacterium KM106-2]|nr:ABC transporter, ATP-binding protein [Lachnospiraceae bacterium KM106-2]
MDELLKVVNLEKKIEAFELHNMSFELKAGYLYGLAGRNAAGKTSLFNLLIGLNKPTNGEIIVDGYDLWKEPERAKQKIAYVLNDSPFSMQMSAKANAKIYGSCYDTFDYSKFTSYCDRFEIPLKKPLHKLSKGMNIKFQLAFALSYDAKLYLMDEPTEGLDPIFRREFREILMDIIAMGDKTVVMSTQLTEELDQLADFLILIHGGRLKLFDSVERLRSEYQIVKGTKLQIDYLEQENLIGRREIGEQEEALIKKTREPIRLSVTTEVPTTADLIYYFQDMRG